MARTALALLSLLLILYAVQLRFALLPDVVAQAFEKFAQNFILGASASLCLLRRGDDRAAWRWLGAAFATWTVGNLYFSVYLWDAQPIPVPSIADVFWLAFYPLLYCGLVSLLRGRIGRIGAARLLDGAIAALVASAVSAILVFGVVVEQGGGSPAAIATTLAYPVGDLILLFVVVAALAVTGWQLGSAWGYIAASLLVFAVADGAYLQGIARGTWDPHSPFGAGWPLAALVLAAGATFAPPAPRASRESDRAAAVPLAFGLLAMALLVYDHFVQVGFVGLLLAAGALVAVLARLGVTVRSAVLGEQQLAEAQRLAKLGSWELDADTGEGRWSSQQYRLLGLDREETDAVYSRLLEAVHPDDRPGVDASVLRCGASGDPFSLEVRLALPHGLSRWVRVEGGRRTERSARRRTVAGTMQDITDQKEAELALERARAVTATVQQIAVAANEAAAPEEAIQRALTSLSLQLGSAHARADLVNDDDMSLVPIAASPPGPSCTVECVHDRAALEATVREVVTTGDIRWVVQPVDPGRAQDGRRCDALVVPVTVGDDVAAVLTFCSTVTEPHSEDVEHLVRAAAAQLSRVVERQAAADVLTYQAGHDSLTGLPNRARLLERLGHALDQRARNPIPVTVMVLDLDGFKLINDSLGHAVGDEVLIRVAERLRRCLRPADTAARLGGDEFAVLLDHAGGAEAMAVADRMLAAIREPLLLESRTVSVGASIGLASASDGITVDEMIRNADLAMYAAKTAGRGRAEVFRPAMHEAARRRQEVEADLRETLDTALAQEQLYLLYQPKVSAAGAVVAVEALIRWQHPTRGVVSPAEFIPIAEETGMIHAVGTWVFRQAFSTSARWAAAGTPLMVCVNVSSRQFRPDLARQVREALEESGADPSTICLELTETAVMSDVTAAAERILELKALGVKVSMDDFGTGYSSLSYLKEFALDELKIDKSFVDGVEGERDAAIVASIIGMAHALGLQVVAEGVEAAGQVQKLTALGCDLLQGFHFSKPRPLADIDRFLSEGHPLIAASAVEAAPLQSPPGGWSILIADDDEALRSTLRTVFEDSGFCVSEAMSGAEALERSRSEPADCLLLDLGLPDMDGLDVCRAVRDPDSDLSTTAVVILTGSIRPGDKIDAFSLGADDYILKPVRSQDLVQLVLAAVQRRQQQSRAPAA